MTSLGGQGMEGGESNHAFGVEFISQLRELSIRSLKRMYLPDERLFVFRLRKAGGEIVREGLSQRYTAIALIGLARESESAAASVLAGHRLHDVCVRLIRDIQRIDNLGDIALTLWALNAVDFPNRRPVLERLMAFRPSEQTYPTVEIAWALSALCADSKASAGDLRQHFAHRLLSSFNKHSGMFPHVIGEKSGGLRSHVTCFADLVYPIHALTYYFRLSEDAAALEAALRCAYQICQLQGSAGQWWWHYDCRTGNVIEPYPIYAIHQDAMAPMALFALQEAAGKDFTTGVKRGLAWLAHPPELSGSSLIDIDSDIIWRKVGRREPGKLSRYVQAIATRVHSSIRMPGLDMIFPAGAIDYEDRPYHLGWLLYAWPTSRVNGWGKGETAL
jgi:hypothetical protein